jgi:sporulation protein YlmC with PRC-barrel domain
LARLPKPFFIDAQGHVMGSCTYAPAGTFLSKLVERLAWAEIQRTIEVEMRKTMRERNMTRLTRFALLPAVAAVAFASQVQAAGASHDRSRTQADTGYFSQVPTIAKRDLRASEVIGMSVRNDQGKNIGQISDMIVDLKTSEVRYAILTFDPGILSGERLFAVPTSQLRMAPDRNDVIYPMREARLEQAAINKSDWNSKYLSNGEQVARLNKAWDIRQPSEGARAYRASDLIGKNVILPNQAPIGHVEELVVDMAGQKVHYAVVNFDHDWLGSEKRVAVPLRSLQLARGDKEDLMLNVDRAQVAASTGFEKSDYQRLDNRVLMTRIDRHLSFFPDPNKPKTAQTDSGSQPAHAGTRSMGARADHPRDTTR